MTASGVIRQPHCPKLIFRNSRTKHVLAEWSTSGAEAAKADWAQPKQLLSAETAALLGHIQSDVRAELDIAPYPERVSGGCRRRECLVLNPKRLAPERPVARDFLRDGTSCRGFMRSTARECSSRRFASTPSDMGKAIIPTTAPSPRPNERIASSGPLGAELADAPLCPTATPLLMPSLGDNLD